MKIDGYEMENKRAGKIKQEESLLSRTCCHNCLIFNNFNVPIENTYNYVLVAGA
jgi:hypothetical protein